jgi:hypothetical protein
VLVMRRKEGSTVLVGIIRRRDADGLIKKLHKESKASQE